MKTQTVKIDLGQVQLRLSLGDADSNGVIDVSLRIRVVGLFELPPIIVNIDANTALEVKVALEKLGAAFAKKK